MNDYMSLAKRKAAGVGPVWIGDGPIEYRVYFTRADGRRLCSGVRADTVEHALVKFKWNTDFHGGKATDVAITLEKHDARDPL